MRTHTDIIYCSHAEKIYLSALGAEVFPQPIPAMLLRRGHIYARVVILKDEKPSTEHAALMSNISPRTESSPIDDFVSTDMAHRRIWVDKD